MRFAGRLLRRCDGDRLSANGSGDYNATVMNTFVHLLRADWLTASRARLYGLGLGIATTAFLGWVLTLTALHAAARPVALDFAAFWAAAHLAASGHAAGAYNNALIEATEQAATSMAPGYLAFYYPPTALMLALPLGLLGYSTALAMFLVAEMAVVWAALRRILPQRWAWLPLLTYPGFLMNGLSGQNAALSAACFAGGAVWLDRRPLLAGACLGGLACKPQLAVCIPVALVAARRWRALAACAATAAGLAAFAWLVLGTAAWRGFAANIPMARTDIETIPMKWPMMQSLFGAVRLAGGGNTLAYAAQGTVSLAALCLLVWICARRPGAKLEGAALTTAALLFTPFLYDYDLAVACVPMACLTALAQPRGWLAGEKIVLMLLFVVPLAARAAGMGFRITLGPPLLMALVLVLARRGWLTARETTATA